jgi:hypothetical protein
MWATGRIKDLHFGQLLINQFLQRTPTWPSLTVIISHRSLYKFCVFPTGGNLFCDSQNGNDIVVLSLIVLLSAEEWKDSFTTVVAILQQKLHSRETCPVSHPLSLHPLFH